MHLKPMKRKEDAGLRADDVYDPVELKKFVNFLKDRAKVAVPDWWAAGVTDVDLFPGRHHVFIGPDDPPGATPRKRRDTEAAGRTPSLTEKDGTITYAVGGRSVSFPKDTFDTFVPWEPLGILGEKHSVVVAFVSIDGPSYQAVGFTGKGGKPVWKADVWAEGRTLSLGGGGYHLVDVTEKEGVVCVFGIETHGAYAEAFDLAKFRFCTCYWCNWSEAWGLK
jgi:hypothetical protein